MAQCTTQGTALQTPAPHLPQDLAKLRRRCGRQCRGIGQVFVTLVRQTARPLLARGEPVLPWAQAARAHLSDVPQLSGDQRARLDPQLATALEAHQRLASPSRRLTRGQAWRHGKRVNADDPTMAPIGQGPSHGPPQLGRKPGLIAEPAAGFIVALPLPGGHPRHASAVAPLVDKVEQAIARGSTQPGPAIHALAGDLARHDAALREALHARGMLTVGLPHPLDSLPPSPTPADVLRSLDKAALHHIRTPSPLHLASAWGYSRPVVERIMASLLCRGAGRLTYKGQRGAIVQPGMAVMAHNAATLGRIHAYRLSQRARTFRRRLRWRCRQVSPCHASIN